MSNKATTDWNGEKRQMPSNNLYDESMSGLLPPLRQPYWDGTPPEVFATLVSNPAFQDALANFNSCNDSSNQSSEQQRTSVIDNHTDYGQWDPSVAEATQSVKGSKEGTSNQRKEQCTQSQSVERPSASNKGESGPPLHSQGILTQPSVTNSKVNFSLQASEFIPKTNRSSGQSQNFGNVANRSVETNTSCGNEMLKRERKHIYYQSGSPETTTSQQDTTARVTGGMHEAKSRTEIEDEANLDEIEQESQRQDISQVFMNYLQKSKLYPHIFRMNMKVALSLLKMMISEQEQMKCLVSLMMKECILHPDSSFYTIQLCKELSSYSENWGYYNEFRRCIFDEAQENYLKVLKTVKTVGNESSSQGADPNVPSSEENAIGTLSLLGELYMSFTPTMFPSVPKKKLLTNYHMFGSAVLELIRNLLTLDLKDAHLKAIYNVYKMVGVYVELGESGNLPTEKEKLYSCLDNLRQECKNEKLKVLAGDMLKLREEFIKEKGQQSPQSPDGGNGESADNHHDPQTNENCEFRDDVYELNEDLELEFSMLSELMIDDEPAEVQDAYEEFLSGLSQ